MKNDCLTYTIFNTNVQSRFGINHWIPFKENEVNAKEKFASNFMTDYINGKLKTNNMQMKPLFRFLVFVGA